MRLNRVLLLAATISLMMFALVFTISCSGDDGKNGKNGASCEVEQDGLDWNIFCGGDEVGKIHGGNGQDGADGKDGADGENCWLVKSGNGYDVRCGAGAGQLKGQLDGCAIYTDVSSPYLVVISCGKAADINICNNQIFDPKQKECSEDGQLWESSPDDIQLCPSLEVSVKGTKYDKRKQYCGWGPTDKEVYNAKATVYDVCGLSYDSQTQPNDGDDYNPEEYCRFYGKGKINAKLAGDDVGDFCNGKPINKDGWRTEYCGFANIDTKVKTVVTGACDLYEEGGARGPNELSFGQGYCEVKFEDRMFPNRPSRESIDSLGKWTTYSEALCGTSENNKPNNGVWKDEYCGYASEESEESDTKTKVYTGICDDTESSEEIKAAHVLGYYKGYCEVSFDNRYNGKTTYTEEHFCNEDPTQRPNEFTWKREYCGFASATSDLAVVEGICDDGQGPSEDSYSPDEYCRFDREQNATFKTDEVCDNGDKVNQDVWKGEYCGYAIRGATTTSKQTGICDDGKGPNSEEFGGGYCRVFPAEDGSRKHLKDGAPTQYSDEFCGASGKVNEGKWKGEYCGYANKTADDAEKVWTGGCENGDGKHKDAYNNDGESGYCQAPAPTSSGAEYGATYWTTEFCNPGDPDKKQAPSGPVNKDSWKGEYCFNDKKVASCKGGLEPDISLPSTSTNRCVLPSAKHRCVDDVGIFGQPSELKDGLCQISIPEGETNDDGVAYTVSGYAGGTLAEANNCYFKGKNAINGNLAKDYTNVNSNGAFVASTCTIVLNSTQISKEHCVSEDIKDGQGRILAYGRDYTTPSISNSNCYGGSIADITNYNLWTISDKDRTQMKTTYAGKIVNSNFANSYANLGYAWYTGNGDFKSNAARTNLEIIKTFTKTCEWDDTNNQCKITITQNTDPKVLTAKFPNSIGRNWYSPGNGFGIGTGTTGIGVCPTNAVTNVVSGKLAQTCKYVP